MAAACSPSFFTFKDTFLSKPSSSRCTQRMPFVIQNRGCKLQAIAQLPTSVRVSAAPTMSKLHDLDPSAMLLKQRIIFLGSQVDDFTADVIISQLLLLDAEDPTKDINSPGGSVTAGMGIYDAIKLCKADVSTVCFGLAASMGAFLLASGTKGKRYCMPNSRVMIHQPLGGASGSVSECKAIEVGLQVREMMYHKVKLTKIMSRLTGKTEEQICCQVALSTNILYKTVDTVWSIHGQSTTEQPRSRARIVASLDSDAGKADGARKALEQAFQGKNSLAKKWEEEIRKRELSGGDGISGGGSGGGGGGGWGGGGGGDEEDMGEGFGQDEPWDWEEFGQTFMATFALLLLYISITHGPKQILKKFKLLFRYIRQGFRLRKIPEEYLTAEGSGIPSDDEEVDEDEEDDYEDSDEAAADFIRERRAVAREADVKKDDANDDETEDDEEDNDEIPTPLARQSRREDLLSKRQAEQKEKLLQLLTPKELRQQQEEKK